MTDEGCKLPLVDFEVRTWRTIDTGNVNCMKDRLSALIDREGLGTYQCITGFAYGS